MPIAGQRTRFRCLYLTHHSPWPTFSGGRIRDAQLVHHLVPHVDLELVAITRTLTTDVQALADHQIPGLQVKLFQDESSPSAIPRRYSRAARRYLRRLIANHHYDVIHVEGHYLIPLLRADAASNTVLAEHNVESTLLAQRAAIEGDAELARRANQLRRQENAAWRRSRYIVALTTDDAAAISTALPEVDVRVIGNGWDHVAQRTPMVEPSSRRVEAPRLLFLANFAYSPNQDAVGWLLDDVFPRVRARMGDATLVLAGANMDMVPRRHAADIPSVHVVGWLPDTAAELDRADVVVCPLRIGGGLKVKTTEALRRGCPLVSTEIGVQGLSAMQRAATLVADDAETFAQKIVRVCTEPQLRAGLLTKLREAQTDMPSWSESAASLLDVWTAVASKAHREMAG